MMYFSNIELEDQVVALKKIAATTGVAIETVAAIMHADALQSLVLALDSRLADHNERFEGLGRCVLDLAEVITTK